MAKDPTVDKDPGETHSNYRAQGRADAARANAFLDAIREGNPDILREPQYAVVVLNNYVAAVIAKGDTVIHP